MSITARVPTTVEIESVLDRDPLVISSDAMVIEAIAQMSGGYLLGDLPRPPSSCAVVLEQDRVVGLLTERDVVRLVAERQPLDCLKLAQVMRSPVLTLPEAALTDETVAFNLLQQHGLSHLPIVDNQGCLVGLVTAERLLQITHRSTQSDRERHELTDHKQADLAHQNSAAQFRRIAENVQGMIYRYLLHPNGQDEFTYVSPRAWDIFELDPAAIVQDKQIIWSIIDAEDVNRIRLEVLASAQELTPFRSEFRVNTPHSGTKWVQGFSSPEPQQNGDILWDGVFVDVTERKQAEQQLHQQAQRAIILNKITQKIRESLDLHTIFENACREIRHMIQADRVGIFQFYSNGSFDSGEFVAESVVDGFSSVLGQQVNDHCFGNNYASLYSHGRCFVANDIYHNGLLNCHTDILAQFKVQANMVMPLLCGTELWGLLCIHQCTNTRQWQQHEVDLTHQIGNQLAIAIQQANLVERLQQELLERQQAQLQLTERNEELARATRLKDEFLANMSHELRTPLNAILGMTEGIQEEVFGTVTPRQLKSLQTIERSGTHLLELINDILDVAKIESGQIELEYTPTALTSLCQSSLAFIKQQSLKKGIQLELKLPSYLPDILVDERRIRQVLINLLNNAVKFTPEGGKIVLDVSYHKHAVSLAETDLSGIDRVSINRESWERKLELEIQSGRAAVREYIRITITDTGIGIAPEYINKLFQPFIQIDSALNRQYAGTGLGLALVKRIVEMHGGEVGLTSQVGIGSCFSIELPYAMNSSSILVANPPEPSSLAMNYTDEKMSPLILLAEDNEANISTILSYLEMKGYRLVVANDGREAIALAQSQHPDLILMDIQMPGMDGIEAMQNIRRDPQLLEVPIIALTALAMVGDRERCLAAGANDYLSKPIKLKQLASNIQTMLAAKFNQN